MIDILAPEHLIKNSSNKFGFFIFILLIIFLNKIVLSTNLKWGQFNVFLKLLNIFAKRDTLLIGLFISSFFTSSSAG